MKKTGIFILVILLLFCLWNCNLIIYGIRQGYGQAKILWKSVPIEKVLQDENFPDSLKHKILLIQEIKKFTVDSLGFINTKNYATFYDQKHQPILWVVTACPYFSLDEYKWYFPFVGEVGYKGFFNKQQAIKEARRISKKGYDTAVDEVNAWSTLGWFKDPVLSSMLYKQEGDLANLIIHELTHTTIYLKNNNDMSENLASFVGHRGALLFLKNKYGIHSKVYKKYIENYRDREKFSQHILRGAKMLDSLYNSQSFAALDTDKKWVMKKAMIHQIIASADTLTLKNKRLVELLHTNKDTINNTFFSGFNMYKAHQQTIDSIYRYQCNSNLRELIARYRKTKN